jgi:hypothetical protein
MPIIQGRRHRGTCQLFQNTTHSVGYPGILNRYCDEHINFRHPPYDHKWMLDSTLDFVLALLGRELDSSQLDSPVLQRRPVLLAKRDISPSLQP